MKRLFLFLFILGISIVARAQEEITDSPRFKPFAGITYNLHPLGMPPMAPETELTRVSQFPGIEFGFTLLPRNLKGWRLNYSNTFLGELAIYGIAKKLNAPLDQNLLGGITGQTVGNGFLGRVDLGKTVIYTPQKILAAGFSLSDKVILGTDYLSYSSSGRPPILYTKEGFHLTPGIFTSYRQQFQNQASLTLNMCISHSILNVHQFEEEGIFDVYVHPLFAEFDLVYELPNGLYFRMGTVAALAFEGVNSDARINGGIGFRFRR